MENNDPLSYVVEYLKMTNNIELANKLIDAFAKMFIGLEQFNVIARLYHFIGNYEKAEEYALKVLDLCTHEEEKFNARSNLVKLYNSNNKPNEALKYLDINLNLVPQSQDLLLEKSISLFTLNKKDEARKILKLLKENEQYFDDEFKARLDYNLSSYYLMEGNLIQGLKELFLNKLPRQPQTLPFKFWNGGAFPGKTLLMFPGLGGWGDNFLAIRFYKDLEDIGFNPIYLTHRPELYKIFNANGYKTIMDLNEISDIDQNNILWTHITEIPIYLDVDPNTLARGKYLSPTNEAKEKWKYIKKSKKLKIGLKWSGDANNEVAMKRALPISDIMNMLNNIFKNKDVEYYSLEIDKEYEGLPIIEQNYDDTLAIIENLDLVITCCTSILHASAIIGTETLAIIPIASYYTWNSPCSNERGSIWYNDNLKLFRQSVFNSWQEPIEELKNYLIENYSK